MCDIIRPTKRHLYILSVQAPIQRGVLTKSNAFVQNVRTFEVGGLFIAFCQQKTHEIIFGLAQRIETKNFEELMPDKRN